MSYPSRRRPVSATSVQTLHAPDVRMTPPSKSSRRPETAQSRHTAGGSWGMTMSRPGPPPPPPQHTPSANTPEVDRPAGPSIANPAAQQRHGFAQGDRIGCRAAWPGCQAFASCAPLHNRRSSGTRCRKGAPEEGRRVWWSRRTSVCPGPTEQERMNHCDHQCSLDMYMTPLCIPLYT